jgi:hypothetical protein
MTKEEKIASLDKAMTTKTREDGTEFHYFSDEAPDELKEVYLMHYEVRDQDYQIFSDACGLVSECINDNMQEQDGADFVNEMIYERSGDRASIMTYDRLSYLNIWNESDISDVMREYDMRSIADACAVWYDREVEQASIIINEWIHA